MFVKMPTHIHMVHTKRGWHIYKGDEVGVDVDQLGDKTEAKRVQNFTSGVSTRRVRAVRRCHRRPVYKRQCFTVCTGRWSRSDRTLGSYVWSVAIESEQASVFDRTLGHFITGRWVAVFGPTNVEAQRRGEMTGR